MHEATRRLLGVLLQHLDGFDHKKKTGGCRGVLPAGGRTACWRAYCLRVGVLPAGSAPRCRACCSLNLNQSAILPCCLQRLLPTSPPPARAVFIGATNRKADLDPALRSRFAASVKFDLPGEEAR